MSRTPLLLWKHVSEKWSAFVWRKLASSPLRQRRGDGGAKQKSRAQRGEKFILALIWQQILSLFLLRKWIDTLDFVQWHLRITLKNVSPLFSKYTIDHINNFSKTTFKIPIFDLRVRCARRATTARRNRGECFAPHLGRESVKLKMFRKIRWLTTLSETSSNGIFE